MINKVENLCKICNSHFLASRLANFCSKKCMNDNWYVLNKEHRLTKNNLYRKDVNVNEKVKITIKKWHNRNSDYHAKYRYINRKKIALHKKQRYHNDLKFKIKSNLRNRLSHAIKNNQKVGSAINDLNCSINKLKIHLQLKFHRNPRNKHEYMTWDNYGKWHIDHVKPLASFDLTDRKQFLDACNYINLQPLWAKDNLRKGDNNG